MIDRNCRRPHIAVVAVLADIRRLYVCQVLAGGVYAVVAAEAVARNIHVIECRRPPGNRRMTVIAGIVTGDVCRVFAGCGDAVMAGTTDADDVCVVNGKHRYEHIGVVAVLADITCLNMLRILTGRIHAVVAIDAIARNVQVIEIRGQPGNGRMTIVASIATGNVRRVFAGRGNAVMTRAAGANDLQMVDRRRWRKHIRAVAVFADVAGLNVGKAFTGSGHAVMAGAAGIRDIGVVEVCR